MKIPKNVRELALKHKINVNRDANGDYTIWAHGDRWKNFAQSSGGAMNKIRMLARSKNPVVRLWGLYARRGRGPLMHYDGWKFTNNGKPKRFVKASEALARGRIVKSQFPILDRYSLFVRPIKIGKAEKLQSNPSPRDRAADLLEAFSGHEPTKVLTIEDRPIKTGLAIGELDFVGYTTKRDGKRESYIHRFRKKSRPLLATNQDGTVLRILGGEFEFTEAGIEDR